MRDTYRHKGMRRKLVQQLQKDNRFCAVVLAAIGSLPRHFFVDSAFEELVYKDQALPIGWGQTLSQPSTVAWQCSLLGPLGGQRILEIGTGSGYQAVLLQQLGAIVDTYERQEALYLQAKKRFDALKLENLRSYFGDSTKLAPLEQPYDGILMSCAAEQIPKNLLAQLKISGRLVLPLLLDGQQRMFVVERKAAKTFEYEDQGPCRFVPFLKGTVRANQK
ncbi:protein-L-isoaspartate(D-aspartate) O-methyltransferase [Saprospira sp. CCB-QB6]|uniref:protein-L-isoaspartate O-methyltransferase family protein n=1 Tax=Saprospira sp. CCB-QB6 TaxID=3023936 RepID=UPI00234B714B|nr:protein-L-isoaspartate(D-aspartate) O-methyltransferase [Saprospira sp. CCB-QB6]WCL80215.1 protein-L-isoaspartate(D-aspartate) O-methyltransferase [Saprospira sp. CCB-QB6]